MVHSLSVERFRRLIATARLAFERAPSEGRGPNTLVKTVEYHNVGIDGYDAEHWHGSYLLLRDACEKALEPFLSDDDVAEEAIYCEAIEQVGAAILATTEFKSYVATGGQREHGSFKHYLAAIPSPVSEPTDTERLDWLDKQREPMTQNAGHEHIGNMWGVVGQCEIIREAIDAARRPKEAP